MEPIGFVVRRDTRSGLDDKEVAQLPDPHPVTWSRRHSQLNTTQVNGGTLNSTRVKSTRWRQKSPLYPNSPPFLLFKTVKIPQPGKNRGSPNFFKWITFLVLSLRWEQTHYEENKSAGCCFHLFIHEQWLLYTVRIGYVLLPQICNLFPEHTITKKPSCFEINGFRWNMYF